MQNRWIFILLIGVGILTLADGVMALVPPANVQASDGNYDDGVLVTWTSVPGVSIYSITQCSTPNPDDAFHCTSITDSFASFSYKFLATPCTKYYYWVRACDVGANACSRYSVYDSGWQKIAPPTITASSHRFDAVEIRIEAAHAGAQAFKIYASQIPTENPAPLSEWNSGATGVYEHLASSGSLYYYWAKSAADFSGNCQSSLSAKTIGCRKLESPVNLSAAYIPDPDPSRDKIRLTWSKVPGATRYVVMRGGAGNVIAATSAEEYLDANIETNASYTYSVQAAFDAPATYAGCWSDVSAPVQIFTPPAP